MNKYQKFILEAKIGGAAGFGPPPKKATNEKPLTKDQIATWRARSDAYREDYLKAHPDSRLKDVPARGSIVTRSKKISNKPEAKAVASSAGSWLLAMGLRHISKKQEHKSAIHKHVGEFLAARDRTKFKDKAVETFTKYFGKLSPKDKSDIQDEVKDIHHNPTSRPSKVLDRKGRTGKFPALLGVAVGAAILGSAAVISGYVPADVFGYLGVKVLDSAVEAISSIGSGDGFTDTFITLLAGQAVANYFHSKDSDEYAQSVQDNTAPTEGEAANDDKPGETKPEEAVQPTVPTPDTPKVEETPKADKKVSNG